MPCVGMWNEIMDRLAGCMQGIRTRPFSKAYLTRNLTYNTFNFCDDVP